MWIARFARVMSFPELGVFRSPGNCRFHVELATTLHMQCPQQHCQYCLLSLCPSIKISSSQHSNMHYRNGDTNTCFCSFAKFFILILTMFPDHLAGDERMLRQKPTQPMEWCQGERSLSMRSLVSLSLDIIMPLIEHFISST